MKCTGAFHACAICQRSLQDMRLPPTSSHLPDGRDRGHDRQEVHGRILGAARKVGDAGKDEKVNPRAYQALIKLGRHFWLHSPSTGRQFAGRHLRSRAFLNTCANTPQKMDCAIHIHVYVPCYSSIRVRWFAMIPCTCIT